MATNFPGSLDSFTNPTSSSTLDSPSHAGQHANINDAMEAVQAKLGVGDHTIGDTQTDWTPTFSNGLTIGNGTATGRYMRVNDLVVAEATITLGSTSTITTFVRMDAPVTAALSYALASGTTGFVADISTGLYWKIGGRPYSGDETYLYGMSRSTATDGIYLNTTLAPITFVSGDRIHVTMTYRV